MGWRKPVFSHIFYSVYDLFLFISDTDNGRYTNGGTPNIDGKNIMLILRRFEI